MGSSNPYIMRHTTFDSEKLRRKLLKTKVMMMNEMKQCLGTETDITVYRKLKELSYLRSYSHNGKHYTLPEIAKFDTLGLWKRKSIYFSKFGTLIDTLENIITTSEMGYLRRI